MTRIGFMQGRLSPLQNGMIQAFPWPCWREEFPQAAKLGFDCVEWTLDQDRLQENPLLADPESVLAVCDEHHVDVVSITGDCFMQAPFFKASGNEQESLIEDARSVIRAAGSVGAGFIVYPLVDNGHIDDEAQRRIIIDTCAELVDLLQQNRTKIVFESDLGPQELARFIEDFDEAAYAINYDTGNSAGMGFDPDEEISAYGNRIENVHIKDREYLGTTVPLGTGNADFPKVFDALVRANYGGNYILQTARAADGDHARALAAYRDQVEGWLEAATQ